MTDTSAQGPSWTTSILPDCWEVVWATGGSPRLYRWGGEPLSFDPAAVASVIEAGSEDGERLFALEFRPGYAARRATFGRPVGTTLDDFRREVDTAISNARPDLNPVKVPANGDDGETGEPQTCD